MSADPRELEDRLRVAIRPSVYLDAPAGADAYMRNYFRAPQVDDKTGALVPLDDVHMTLDEGTSILMIARPLSAFDCVSPRAIPQERTRIGSRVASNVRRRPCS